MFIDFHQIIKQKKAWQDSALENNDFCNLYKTKLKGKNLACSFVPERLRDWGYTDGQILQVLDYSIKKLEINNFRIGLRVTELDFQNHSLGFYKNILELLFKNQCEVILNLGPIKFIAWPEYFLSPSIKNKITNLPKPKSIIAADSKISKLGLQDLETVLKIITKTFTKSQLKNVIGLQPDNEFRNPFGSYKWIFDNSHELKVAALFEKYLPKRKLLIDCAGMWDIDDHLKFVEKFPEPDRIIFGLNYYFLEPVRGPFWWQKTIDRFCFSIKAKSSCLEGLFEAQKNFKFQTEITELQMDPWGRAVLPGNSANALKFALQRCQEYTKPTNGNIRLWGIEHLVSNILFGNPTDDHIKMASLIKNLNTPYKDGKSNSNLFKKKKSIF
jgi:hypothetical protein